MAGINVEDILKGLSAAEQVIELGTKVAGAVEPVVTGILRGITTMKNQDGTMSYVLVLSSGDAAVSDADAHFRNILTKVNAELVAAGKQPLDIPSAD